MSNFKFKFDDGTTEGIYVTLADLYAPPGSESSGFYDGNNVEITGYKDSINHTLKFRSSR